MPPLINQSVDGPKISVVVPCYNATGTLTRCIQSIFGQTLLPQEVFLIDDASQDGTANLAFQLKEAAPKSLRVEVIALKENRGPSAARNIGIARASGDYVALLDSDDYWLPEHLAVNFAVAAQIGEDQVAIVHQPLLINSPEHIATLTQLSHSKVLSGEDVSWRYFSVLYYLFIQKNCSTITLFASAGLAKHVPFPEARRHAEDFQFFIGLFRNARKRAYLVSPRTAVVGKHAWASGTGLSSQHLMMSWGTLKALTQSLMGTVWMPLLIVLWPWHFFKFLRRQLLLYSFYLK